MEYTEVGFMVPSVTISLESKTYGFTVPVVVVVGDPHGETEETLAQRVWEAAMPHADREHYTSRLVCCTVLARLPGRFLQAFLDEPSKVAA